MLQPRKLRQQKRNQRLSIADRTSHISIVSEFHMQTPGRAYEMY